jgi:molecular chaperone GrpE
MPDNESMLNEMAAAAGGTEDLAQVRRERDDFYDRLLRTAAEFDNFRRRTERERREWSDAAAADVVRDLLPIVDDLERALALRRDVGAGPAADAVDAYHRGLELIHRRALDVLRQRGVEPLDVVGRDFDPQWHEAVARDAADGHRDGEITTEIRRGYRMGGRLLRPAQVRVARA